LYKEGSGWQRAKDNIILGTTCRSHESDIIAFKTLRARYEIQSTVMANPRISTAQKVSDWASKLNEQGEATSAPQPPLLSSMTRVINRLKSKTLGRPRVPESLQDLVLNTSNIPNSYKLTREGTPF
jgi:hypothetical protein